MSERQVVGEGPVAYFTPQGQQLGAWLAYLVGQGRLRAAAAPPAAPAMKITAKEPGSTGDNITVTVAENIANRALTDVKVVEEDVYAGVTVAAAAANDANYLPTLLGSATANSPRGSRPGLVRFVDNATPLDPVPSTTDPVVLSVAGGIQKLKVPSATTTAAFELVGRAANPAANNAPAVIWEATITDVDTTRRTFTLTVRWSRTVTVDGSSTQLAALPGLLAFAVTIAPPTQGGALALPAFGSTTLRGGAEPADPKSSTATLYAR
jgi:hypothetical protein